MNGKGDSPRPFSVGYETYARNFDRIRWKDEPEPRGRTYGSCGHEIPNPYLNTQAVRVASEAPDGTRTVRCIVVCPACHDAIAQYGALLANANQEAAWLAGADTFRPW